MKSQESIEWDLSDEELTCKDQSPNDPDHDCEPEVRRRVNSMETKIGLTSTSVGKSLGSKQKNRRARSCKKGGQGLNSNDESLACSHVETQNVAISVMHSPISNKGIGPARGADDHQRLKLITSSGSEESVYVQGEQGQNSVSSS